MTFTGGIGSRMGFHASAPFGFLWFDGAHLSIGGTGLAKRIKPVHVTKADVAAIEISRGFLATRVTIITRDGTRVDPYFATNSRRWVVQTLTDRGWPVEQ